MIWISPKVITFSESGSTFNKNSATNVTQFMAIKIAVSKVISFSRNM